MSSVRPAAAGGPAMAPPRAPGDTWVVVAGGGTIGHLTPGLATAEALAARGLDRHAVAFVGSQRGVEATRLPAAGYEVALLPGRGIQRRLTVENVGAAWGLVRAVGQARRLLRRHAPAVVLATGGYASVPCAVAAAAARIPLVVAEQNAVFGLANRLAVRVGAQAAALSFEGTPLPRRLRPPGDGRFRGRRSAGRLRAVRAARPRPRPLAVVTGNPVRPEVLAVDRARQRGDARGRLGIPADRRVVLVYGGSLGARRLNHAVLAARRRWSEREDLAVRHVVGDRDWELLAADTAPRAGEALLYQPVRFEEALPTCFAAADLVVSRAGASTVAELTAVGLPSVLVPLPHSPGDHQTANAAVLERAGAAVVVPDAELDGDRLGATVEALLAEPSSLEALGAAAAGLGRRDAADRVADLVVACASRPPPDPRPPGQARS